MLARNRRAVYALTTATIGAIVLGLYLAGGFAFLMGGNGTLDLKVHDAPCSACTHVWVTFSSVAVHESNTSGNGWITLNTTTTTLDLLALNGSAMAKSLGLLSLKAGNYEQVRLTVTNVTVDMAGGVVLYAHLEGPTANLNQAFTIASGATTTMNVDIDLNSSLHITPGMGGTLNATFTPNIGAIVVSGG